MQAHIDRHSTCLPKAEHCLPRSASPKERDFGLGKDMRHGQGDLVPIEGDGSIEVADREVSFEQVSDGNEILGGHTSKVRCCHDGGNTGSNPVGDANLLLNNQSFPSTVPAEPRTYTAVTRSTACRSLALQPFALCGRKQCHEA